MDLTKYRQTSDGFGACGVLKKKEDTRFEGNLASKRRPGFNAAISASEKALQWPCALALLSSAFEPNVISALDASGL